MVGPGDDWRDGRACANDIAEPAVNHEDNRPSDCAGMSSSRSDLRERDNHRSFQFNKTDLTQIDERQKEILINNEKLLGAEHVLFG